MLKSVPLIRNYNKNLDLELNVFNLEFSIYYTIKDYNNNGQNQLNQINFDYFSLFTYGTHASKKFKKSNI